MDLPSTLAGKLVLALYAAPLLVAALYDMRTFRIPNAVTAAMLAAFVAAGIIAGLPLLGWLTHLGWGVLVFAVGTGLYAFRVMGGGDVKLLAVTAAWVGGPLLPHFLLGVALLGGALTLALLALRSQTAQMLAGRLLPRARILDRDEGIPYGIAIAAAGLWLAPKLPLIIQG